MRTRDHSWLNRSFYRLGVAYLRLAETQHCTLHPADSCVLPPRGEGIHSQEGQEHSSRQAIASFTRVLENTPEPTSRNLQEEAVTRHLKARWLLNIAYMTVGDYPDQVPDAYVIPPDAFGSEEQIPHFTNIAPHLGLDTFDMSGGAISDDFDNDGYLDIVVSTRDPGGQISLFRNNQDGTFSERTEEAGLLGLFGGLNMVQADYDNDGNVDLLVLRGGWLREQGRHPNSLLRNNGDGTFTNLARQLGVERPTDSFPAWFWDFDNDGVLDLYVSAYAAHIEHLAASTLDLPVNIELTRLYRGTGEGGFEEVSRQYDLVRPSAAMGANFGDLDNDGYLDFYLGTGYPHNDSIMPSVMYRNRNGKRFSDVTYAGGFGHLHKGPECFSPTLTTTEIRTSSSRWAESFQATGLAMSYTRTLDPEITGSRSSSSACVRTGQPSALELGPTSSRTGCRVPSTDT